MKNKIKRKRGIALVVVLGLLALLLMMAVAFSIFMRTERHAAGGYRSDVQSRLLLKAAEAKALEALEKELGYLYYPDWGVLYTTNLTSTKSLSDAQPWADHIPVSLLNHPDYKALAGQVGWIPVPNGRVSYLIFNASGMLDANEAGGGIRGFGRYPGEIDLTGLGAGEVVSVLDLTNGRPYESVAELKNGSRAKPMTINGVQSVSHLVTYSRSPTDGVTPVPVDLSGDENVLAGKAAEITAALGNFSSLHADMCFKALLDYVDADSIPRDLDSPCTERVPMINEVRVLPRTQGLLLALITTVEVAVPFVKPVTGSYKLKWKMSITPGPNTPDTFPTPGTVAGERDIIFSGTFPQVAITPPFVTLTPLEAGVTAYFKVVFEYIEVVDGANNVVDRVNNLQLWGPASVPGPLPVALAPYCPSISIPDPIAGSVPGQRGGVEALDPRYNHLNVCWKPYKLIVDSYTHNASFQDSLGKNNEYADYVLKNNNNDGHYWMHVADQPLQSVGELSYIVRPQGAAAQTHYYWQTVRLLAEKPGAADPIYRYFTLSSGQHGFVNPNTTEKAVLQAVFKGMPLDSYPGEAGAPTVTDAQAGQLATAWVTDSANRATAYSNKHDMITCVNYTNALAAMVSAMSVPTEFRREAGIRNLFGLLNPRQNYFLIALFAQSTSKVRLPRQGDVEGAEIDSVRGDSSALLEVWRDPMPVLVELTEGTTNMYPMFTRRFEVLSED